MHTAPIEQIRAHFPALKRRHASYPVAYFDGPGGTQVPAEVVQTMNEYLYNHNATGDSDYPSSHETDQIVADARVVLADFVNASSPSEIAFGANMTTLTFHLAKAFGRLFNPGDEIVITELEHHANIAPWLRLEQECGITIRKVRMLVESGTLDWEDLTSKLTRQTKLVAIGAASNALGTISDISKISERAHAYGAMVFVDAAHYAPHKLIDVAALDCDFLACSAYKFYGPHVGILYGRHAHLQTLDFSKLMSVPDKPPERVEMGTPNFEGIAGAAAAVDFLASLGRGENRRERLLSTFRGLHDRSARLLQQMWEGLAGIDGVTLHGPQLDGDRTPTVSFTVKEMPSRQVSRHLAKLGVFVSHGDFFATTLVGRLGFAKDGLARAGCACYTTEEEVERLVKGVAEIFRA